MAEELKLGRANVWFCDPEHWSVTQKDKGCGFFGFYKPETDLVVSRICPGCNRSDFYVRTGDVASIVIEPSQQALLEESE